MLKEKINQYQRDYYRKHREVWQKWYKENKERLREYRKDSVREYYKNNRETIINTAREWYLNNKERHREHLRKYYYKKKDSLERRIKEINNQDINKIYKTREDNERYWEPRIKRKDERNVFNEEIKDKVRQDIIDIYKIGDDNQQIETWDRQLECEIIIKKLGIEKLSGREQRIIKMRFGLEHEKPRTLKEISELLGVTRERIRQIEIAALNKLKQNYKED